MICFVLYFFFLFSYINSTFSSSSFWFVVCTVNRRVVYECLACLPACLRVWYHILFLYLQVIHVKAIVQLLKKYEKKYIAIVPRQTQKEENEIKLVLTMQTNQWNITKGNLIEIDRNFLLVLNCTVLFITVR